MINRTKYVAFHGSRSKKADCLHELTGAIKEGALVAASDLLTEDTDLDTPVDEHYIVVEKQLGLPVWFLMLSEFISTKLEEKEAIAWACNLIRAIKIGSDLNSVWSSFACSLLANHGLCLKQFARTDEQACLFDKIALHISEAVKDPEVFERDAQSALELSRQELSDDTSSALYAAYWIAKASKYGSTEGDAARDRAARAVIFACRQCAQTFALKPYVPRLSADSALAVTAGRLLLAVISK